MAFNVVAKADIAANGEYNLSAERYRNEELRMTNYEFVALGEVAEIEYGYTETAQDSGDARFIRITDIDENGRIRETEQKFISLSENSKKYLLKTDDILVARTGATYGKTAIFDEAYDAVFASYLIRINLDRNRVSPKFYWNFAQTDLYWEQAKTLVSRGGQPQFNGHALKKIKIPLPPLDVQQAIVAEIEGYQRIVDGARQVVSAYKPHIKIDSSWEMVNLGEVSDINPPKTELKEIDSGSEVSFLPMADLNENIMNFEPKEVRKIQDVIKGYTYFRDNDVLVAKITPCFENGKAGLARNLVKGIGFGSTEFIVLRAQQEKVLSQWIYYFISSERFRSDGKSQMTGSAGQQRIPKDFVSNYKIPLPRPYHPTAHCGAD